MARSRRELNVRSAWSPPYARASGSHGPVPVDIAQRTGRVSAGVRTPTDLPPWISLASSRRVLRRIYRVTLTQG
jgi:hypothetical protein